MTNIRYLDFGLRHQNQLKESSHSILMNMKKEDFSLYDSYSLSIRIDSCKIDFKMMHEMMREIVRKHLNKDYLEFQELIHFNLEKFREDLKECRTCLDTDLFLFLENEEDPSKIKSALLAFLKTGYKEAVDVLLSAHFWKISMK